MPHYPQSATGLNSATYPVGPTPLGITVTAAGSSHTKGSYTTIAASTAFACNRALLNIQQTNAVAGREYLVDWATGAAASETVIVANAPADGSGAASDISAGIFDYLLAIAASTRLSCRIQSTGASAIILANASILAAGDTPGFTTTTTYGAVTATSHGTSIDPGGTANTKGAYSQITASTSAVTQYLLLATAFGQNTNASVANHYLDIATGAGGAEVVLIPDCPVVILAAPSIALQGREPRSQGYLTYIAASTRIAMRSACSITDATDRLIDAVLIAAVAPSGGGEDSGVAGGGGVPGATTKAFTFHW